MTTEQDNRAFATAERLARRMGGTFVPHEQDNRALVDEPVDSGMNADAVDRAEWLWANLPTRRKWTSLPTHEQALVCHVVAALSRAPDARIAELERALGQLQKLLSDGVDWNDKTPHRIWLNEEAHTGPVVDWVFRVFSTMRDFVDRTLKDQQP